MNECVTSEHLLLLVSRPLFVYLRFSKLLFLPLWPIIIHCLEDVDRAFITITDVWLAYFIGRTLFSLPTQGALLGPAGNFRKFLLAKLMELAIANGRQKGNEKMNVLRSSTYLSRTHYPFGGIVQGLRVRCCSYHRFTLTTPSVMNPMYHITLGGLVRISDRGLCSMKLSHEQKLHQLKLELLPKNECVLKVIFLLLLEFRRRNVHMHCTQDSFWL